MVIINAYLGAGSGGGVPVGKCLLNVAWNPSDGNNKSGATVRAVIGSTTVTGTTDASGNASLLVGTGTCTVTVTPSGGSYTNLSATVTAESTTTKTVVINGNAGRLVTLVMPYTLTTTSWNIKNSSNTQVASGTGAFNDKQVTLLDGSYTLTVVAYGVTKTKTFTVSASSVRIDCTDITCLVTFNLPASLAFTMKIANVSLASNQRFVCVLRNSAALAYSGTCTTQLDGSAIVTVTSANMTPSGATLTVTPTITGVRKLYTANKSLAIPVTGMYKLLLIGGGGAGGIYAGGGSGYVYYNTVKITAGTHQITIGNGGTYDASTYTGTAGGATSFGNIASVAGGASPEKGNGNGGDGGAGGGGVPQSTNSTQRAWGGNGNFGGGGGGGGYYNAYGKQNYGGGGGAYGGHGGGGQISSSASAGIVRSAEAGGAGKAIDNNDGFFSSVGSGYAGGASGGTSNASGGGGGGGYGATGGAGSVPGGGGGGGIAGGNGGNAGTSSVAAGHGLGYGSGGAGESYNGGGMSGSACGGGGGLYNIAQSGANGAKGAVQIMWVG